MLSVTDLWLTPVNSHVIDDGRKEGEYGDEDEELKKILSVYSLYKHLCTINYYQSH